MSRSSSAPIPSLLRWGLSADADLIFRTLSLLGPRTGSQLTRELGLTRTRVEVALSLLRDAAACGITTIRGEEHWHARPTREVVACLNRPHTRRIRPARAPTELLDTAQVVALGPGMRHLTSREAARRRMSRLVAVTGREHLAMNPEASFDAPALQAAAPMDRVLLDRGVRMRVLGIRHNDPDLLIPYGFEPAQSRPSYREVPQVPMKLIVLDRKVALFPVDPHNYDRGYLEVTQEPVVQSLATLFEQHWSTAHDPMEILMPDLVLAPREQAVIALLSQGHTDASTARELRISERSVSTIIRSVMDRLGVENRFQLGVALGTLRIAPLPPGTTALIAKHPKEKS